MHRARRDYRFEHRCDVAFLRAVSLAFGSIAAFSAHASGLQWQIWETPGRIATLDPTDIVLERSSHCLDGCRYDRSNLGNEDPADNPYPLRWLYRDGEEAVLFDERGPGAVTRFWVTTGLGVSTCIDPAIRVRFYVDGAASPTLDVPLAALFDGSTMPFTPPLVADNAASSGGYVSYVPIAYARALRIALVNAENGGFNPCSGDDKRPLWFQIQHHRLAPGTAIDAFSAGQDFPAWRAFLAHAGDDPWNGMLVAQNASSTLAPGATITLATRSGSAWLRGIRLHAPRESYAAIRLRLHFDGAVTVDAPLSDFFATSASATIPARGVFAGEDAGGWLYAWLPMPFRQSASVQLVADADLPAPVAIQSSLSFDASAVPDDAAPLVAVSSNACVPRGDLTLYTHDGAGKIVGVASRYQAAGVPGLGYLEGDERAYVDTATAPAWYGTGIEDFFDGGFYFDHGAFALALSGATEIDPDGSGVTAAYRWMPGDALNYTNALRLAQEAGLAPDQPIPTCARALVYAYRQTRALAVPYDGFDVGGPTAADHAYVPPVGASCAPVDGLFEDEPRSRRSAIACAYSNGSSRFRFVIAGAAAPLRLRRTFDAAAAMPGETAGAPAADIRVNGILAGHFAPAIANPLRRWQQQEALLDPSVAAHALYFEIVPEFTAHAPTFAESRWDLSGGPNDALFIDGFDGESISIAPD